MKRQVFVVMLFLFICFAQRTSSQSGLTPGKAADTQSVAEPLRLVKTISLPGVQGRIDHLAADASGQRLFVCALGNNTLEVVDIKKGERVQSLAGFNEPQGVRYVPEPNLVVVANGGDGVVTFLDGASLKPIKTIRFSGDADNVRYDAKHGRIYVGYGAGALGVLDVKGERVGDIPLGGHPESFQLDSAGKIFVNIPTRHEIAVVDVNKRKVVARWPVSVASNNYPMTLDEAHHRLFVMTRRPPHLLVYDTETGKLVSTLPADGDSDDLFYDGAHGRIYASFGEGSVLVYRQLDADHYQVAARTATAAGARTALYSPELGQFFVAVPHRGNLSAEIRVYQ
jgi:DNA-binding beta-propeller fold protein YncE